MLDWLIIGGGVHGTHLSLVLTSAGGVARDRVRVIDPDEEVLGAFWRLTRATGMTHLRSPGVHHLGVESTSLRRFAGTSGGRRAGRFAFPYERPALSLFRAHVEALVRGHDLAGLRLCARATALDVVPTGLRVETDRGAVEARRVVLAVGPAPHYCWPDWAVGCKKAGGDVSHVFEAADPGEVVAGTTVVVGGGISGGQLALSLARRGANVVWSSRHPLRVHRFDSDPEWLGPKAMSTFDATSDLRRRRAMIAAARRRGSVPPELFTEARHAIHRGVLQHVVAPVSGARRGGDGRMHLELEGHDAIVADRIVLATGFEPLRPGGALVDDAIARLGLSCAECGYPIVSRSLEWGPGLFVTGGLAELELGPTSRNVAGAREAARRLLEAA
ncbi:MAG: FAD/NAD(P)-binding protein [Deltaproteobacteria bacterium]|nr:FAD/NAD(P)-binding protein [Deltaproteobacteria bacterium]